tara:strand:- start:679 stop:1035 length:357 start_codon:yes stop_codon:yes gene_type:complete
MGKKKKPKAQKITIQAPPPVTTPKKPKAKKGAPSKAVRTKTGVSTTSIDPSVDIGAGGVRSGVGVKVAKLGSGAIAGGLGLSGVKAISDQSGKVTALGDGPQLKGKSKLKDFVNNKNL